MDCYNDTKLGWRSIRPDSILESIPQILRPYLGNVDNVRSWFLNNRGECQPQGVLHQNS